MDDSEKSEAPAPRPRDGRDGHGIGLVGTSILVFILGVVVGIPIANFGADVLVRYAGEVFAILFGIFLIIVLVGGLIGLFRRRIWGAIFKRTEFEMERFARPLAEVAKFAAEQKVVEATGAARDLAELVLARYAWVSTRRWLIATLTALIAAIAALAGSALLFQQNRLLADQSELMAEQTERLSEQNKLLETQIELGEAQRSAAIVPEILEIGTTLGNEAEALKASEQPMGISASQLSGGLQGRIIAASNMARPYRFLNAALIDISEAELYRMAVLRRTDLADPDNAAWTAAPPVQAGAGGLIDRIVSPERGQLLMLLGNAFVTETESLSFRGADFSFAYVRMDALKAMSLNHASLRFADFSGIVIDRATFRGAYAEHSRFNGAMISNTDFRSLPGTEAKPPYGTIGSFTFGTHLTGAEFINTGFASVDFENVDGLAINFDGALMTDVDFRGASLAGATFRNAILAKVQLEGADLKSVDFDGAVTDDAGFIDRLAAVARPGTFIADRYVVEPVEREALAGLPHYYDLWSTGWADDLPLFRVRRVKDFR